MSLYNFVKEKYIKKNKITPKNVSFLCVCDTYEYVDICQCIHVTLIMSIYHIQSKHRYHDIYTCTYITYMYIHVQNFLGKMVRDNFL